MREICPGATDAKSRKKSGTKKDKEKRAGPSPAPKIVSTLFSPNALDLSLLGRGDAACARQGSSRDLDHQIASALHHADLTAFCSRRIPPCHLFRQQARFFAAAHNSSFVSPESRCFPIVGADASLMRLIWCFATTSCATPHRRRGRCRARTAATTHPPCARCWCWRCRRCWRCCAPPDRSTCARHRRRP